MDNSFWIIVSAVGTCLGALATTAAVIVALWQTRQSSKKQLKLLYNESIILKNPTTYETIGDYIGITIINIGNRKVIISDWSIISTNSKKGNRYKIMTELQGNLKQTLPKNLDIEESLELAFDRQFFSNLVTDMIKKKEIKETQKVKFQVMDSTGKKYYIFSKNAASKYKNISK